MVESDTVTEYLDDATQSEADLYREQVHDAVLEAVIALPVDTLPTQWLTPEYQHREPVCIPLDKLAYKIRLEIERLKDEEVNDDEISLQYRTLSYGIFDSSECTSGSPTITHAHARLHAGLPHGQFDLKKNDLGEEINRRAIIEGIKLVLKGNGDLASGELFAVAPSDGLYKMEYYYGAYNTNPSTLEIQL